MSLSLSCSRELLAWAVRVSCSWKFMRCNLNNLHGFAMSLWYHQSNDCENSVWFLFKTSLFIPLMKRMTSVYGWVFPMYLTTIVCSSPLHHKSKYLVENLSEASVSQLPSPPPFLAVHLNNKWRMTTAAGSMCSKRVGYLGCHSIEDSAGLSCLLVIQS